MKNNRGQRGQVIVIIALAVIAVMSFTALAVDGSMVYSEKRTDQSVSDSTALAAAGAAAQYLKTSNMSGYACGGTVSAGAASAAITQAIHTANVSGITLTANDISVSGVTTSCGTYNGRNFIDVHVVVTTEVQPRFLSLIRDDPIQTAAESVARVYINTTFASGNLIYTTGTACSYSSAPYGGIHATGNGNISVKHGGIFSNSCIQATGSSDIFVYDGVAQYMGVGTKTFYSGSKKQTTVSNGLLPNTNTTAFILNDLDTTSGASISTYTSQSYQLWSTYTANSAIPEAFWPTATTQTVTADMEDIVLPTCSTTARTFPSSSGGVNQTVYPGTYSSAASYGAWGGYTLTFAPGVYCFNSSLSLGGGSDTVIMKDVVLYFKGTGGITFGGTIKPTMDGSSVFITSGAFDLASGIPLNAENFFVYIASGKFSISGAATGTISSFNTSNSVYAIPGVLVYMGDSNTSNVEINGSGGLVASGTIYAPNSLVQVTGASTSNTMNVQIIGKAVWVAGSGTVNMDADGATLYSQGSTTIQLMK
jgi:hypothetical protein